MFDLAFVLVVFFRCLPDYALSISPYRNDSRPRSEKLKLEMPNMAPYEEDIHVDPLSALEFEHRIFIQQIFSKAFTIYCEHADATITQRIVIKPVFFYPSERVDLPCQFCNREQAHNGRIKHWRVLRRKFFTKFHRLKSIPLERWRVLDDHWTADEYRLNKGHYHNVEEPNPRMPLHHPRDRPYGDRTFHKNDRPEMKIFQRDGRLTFLHSEASAYGLYNCFDNSDRKNLDIIYYLIPYMPYLKTTVFPMHVFRYECNGEEANYASNLRQFENERFDPFHRFHVITPTAYHSDQYVLRHWFSPEIDFSRNMFYGNESHVVYRVANVTRKNYDVNLHIYIHWTRWSECNPVTRLRTRRGACHIGRADRTVEFKPDPYTRDLLKSTGYEMFLFIHRIMQHVRAFKYIGIPLFSGIFQHLIIGDGKKDFGQCTNLELSNTWTVKDEFGKTPRDAVNFWHYILLEKILRNGSEIYHDFGLMREERRYLLIKNYCFYANNTERKIIYKKAKIRFKHQRLLYGYSVNQNAMC